MQLLLASQQIEVNCPDDEGWTALHWAANNNNVEATQLLLASQQIDVNKNIDGVTALHCAAAQRNGETIQLLLGNQQVDVNLKENYGNTAFLWTLYGSGELPQCFCR